MKDTNQSKDNLSTEISEYCESKFELNRMPLALKAKWCSLRKGVSINLASKGQIMKGKNSGRTEEALMEISMTYNRLKVRRKMPNGERNNGAEFKYLEAAKFLNDYQKFGGLCEEEGC